MWWWWWSNTNQHISDYRNFFDSGSLITPARLIAVDYVRVTVARSVTVIGLTGAMYQKRKKRRKKECVCVVL